MENSKEFLIPQKKVLLPYRNNTFPGWAIHLNSQQLVGESNP